MSGPCGTYGGKGEMHTGFWWGNLNQRDKLEDLGVDGRKMIKMDLKERRWQIVDWINMVQDKQKWWAVVIAVTNFGINKIWGTS